MDCFVRLKDYPALPFQQIYNINSSIICIETQLLGDFNSNKINSRRKYVQSQNKKKEKGTPKF